MFTSAIFFLPMFFSVFTFLLLVISLFGCAEIFEQILYGTPLVTPVITGARPIAPISTSPDANPSFIACPEFSTLHSISTPS